VRHGVLVGSVAGAILLGATTALVLHHGGPAERGPASQQTAGLNPSDPSSRTSGPTETNPAPQPHRPVPPSFDIVKVAPSGNAVIAGRAEPGSKVTVRDGDKVIGEVTADGRGEWVLVPAQPIRPGDRLLSLEASREDGGTAVKSEETVALSVSPAAPGATAETALAVVLPRDGAGAARVLQRPEGSPANAAGTPASEKPSALSLDTVEYDEQGRVALSGRAAPGARVQIYLGNQPVATATADAAGEWSATSARPVAPGPHELRLDQLAADGHVVRRVAAPLTRAAPVQLAAGQDYLVQPGNSLWQIARRTYGNGMRYVIIYSANLGQIRDPERIYPGQVFKIPKS
jgi:nucleoid-associated protein YgaU